MSIFLCLIFSFCCQQGHPLRPDDQAILNRYFNYAEENRLSNLPLNERIVKTGEFFLNTPYQGGTLEGNPKEKLVVNLRQLDCVTFIDNVIALALLEEYDAKATEQFLSYLQKIRYRNGEIRDYTSRLHYSSDWLHEMVELKYFTDVTAKNGGIPFPNKVGFISQNHSKYPALVQDSTLVGQMSRIEQTINARNYFFIPKEKVIEKTGQIQNGDIVLITTNKKGLDTAHVGIAMEKNGTIYLLHASITAKKVVVSETSLSLYLKKISSHSGIMIARPIIN